MNFPALSSFSLLYAKKDVIYNVRNKAISILACVRCSETASIFISVREKKVRSTYWQLPAIAEGILCLRYRQHSRLCSVRTHFLTRDHLWACLLYNSSPTDLCTAPVDPDADPSTKPALHRVDLCPCFATMHSLHLHRAPRLVLLQSRLVVELSHSCNSRLYGPTTLLPHSIVDTLS